MARYISRPATIEAMVFEGTYASHDALRAWIIECEGDERHPDGRPKCCYRGLNILSKPQRYQFCFAVAKNGGAVAVLGKGDALVREPDGGGFYPCEGAIFEKRWQPETDTIPSDREIALAVADRLEREDSVESTCYAAGQIYEAFGLD